EIQRRAIAGENRRADRRAFVLRTSTSGDRRTSSPAGALRTRKGPAGGRPEVAVATLGVRRNSSRGDKNGIRGLRQKGGVERSSMPAAAGGRSDAGQRASMGEGGVESQVTRSVMWIGSISREGF